MILETEMEITTMNKLILAIGISLFLFPSSYADPEFKFYGYTNQTFSFIDDGKDSERKVNTNTDSVDGFDTGQDYEIDFGLRARRPVNYSDDENTGTENPGTSTTLGGVIVNGPTVSTNTNPGLGSNPSGETSQGGSTFNPDLGMWDDLDIVHAIPTDLSLGEDVDPKKDRLNARKDYLETELDKVNKEIDFWDKYSDLDEYELDLYEFLNGKKERLERGLEEVSTELGETDLAGSGELIQPGDGDLDEGRRVTGEVELHDGIDNDRAEEGDDLILGGEGHDPFIYDADFNNNSGDGIDLDVMGSSSVNMIIEPNTVDSNSLDGIQLRLQPKGTEFDPTLTNDFEGDVSDPTTKTDSSSSPSPIKGAIDQLFGKGKVASEKGDQTVAPERKTVHDKRLKGSAERSSDQMKKNLDVQNKGSEPGGVKVATGNEAPKEGAPKTTKQRPKAVQASKGGK